MLSRTINLYRNSFSGLSRDVWMLSLITLINRSGTMVIPFLTVYLTTRLDFTLAQAGLVMSAFGVGSVLGTYAGGWLTDRVGFYPTMFWSLFLSGSLFIVLMWAQTFVEFCAVVFMISLVGDAFRPALMASLTAYGKHENHTRSLSLIRLAINLGIAIGPAVGGMIAAWFGYTWLFIIDGCTCMLAALYMRQVLQPKEEPEEYVTEADQNKTVKGKSAYKDVLYMIFILFMLFEMICFMQLFTTLPVFYKEVYFLDESQIGWLLAFNGLLIVIFEMPIIYLMEHRFNKLDMIAFGAGLIALSYLVFNWMPGWCGILLFSMLLITFGEIINFPFTNSFALSRSTQGRRGQYMGLYSMAFSVSLIIGPYLGTQIAQQYGFDVMWNLVGGLCILATVGFLGIKQYLAKTLA